MREWVSTTESRSGFKVTTVMGVQFRVGPDQRRGLRSRARQYNSGEYTFGMEEFAELGPREARKLAPKPESVDQWGGQPKPGYASTGMIVSA